MVSHVHDSHVTTIPLFHEILSGAPPPVYARWIEGSPVIAGFDGEEAKTRMDGIVKYISASTPQALMATLLTSRYLVEFAPRLAGTAFATPTGGNCSGSVSSSTSK